MNNTDKNIVMCANPEKGHYFDGNSYSKCPHCGCDRIAITVIPDEPVKGKKQKGLMEKLFGNDKKHDKEPKSRLRSSSIPKTIPKTEEVTEEPIHTPTVKLKEEELFSESNAPYEPEKEYISESSGDITYDIYNGKPTEYTGYLEDNAENNDDYNGDDFEEPEIIEEEPKSIEEAPEFKKIPEKFEQKEPAETGGGLADVIKEVSANAEGKTMSYFDSAKPVSEKEERKNIDPVVGWLVCVEGAHFGESFNISAGMNSIGRNNSNRIVFNLDKSVSREKHAFITYEPKKRRFFIKPGDSSGLTYVNDEYVTESVLLNAMDIIELGNSKFILIPLCGENFSWENYISKE